VPSTVIEEGGVTTEGARQGRLKVLFFLPDIAHFRVFENLLQALLGAGHQVFVAFDRHRKGLAAADAALLDELGRKHPSFDHRQLPARPGLWRIAASAIRRSLDYFRYLEPEYADAGELREQARARAPRVMRALLFLPPFRWAAGRRALGWLLRRVEAALPRPAGIKSFVSEQAPDVVLVSPLVESASGQADYVRVAAAARIPSVLVAASEEDLTSKGEIRDAPTLTVTADEERIDEVVRFQGLPRDRIVAVGAQSVNGHRPPAPPGTLEAVERAARMDVVARREGRVLRPVLLLLTPLLALLLALLRPRTTARLAIKGVRRWAVRIRRRARTLRRTASRGRAERSKARGRAAKEEKLARADAVKHAKLERAERKKQGKASAVAAKQAKRAEAREAKGARKARPSANDGDQATADATDETENPQG
jgi:hypothetical protein